MRTIETLQDQFLSALCRQRCAVTIFMMNGFQLRGVITGCDNYAVTVSSDGRQSMIYKHAISTITPAVPLQAEETA